jgi:hypothetical protein
VIGQYDAAVIDKEDGKPHVVTRMDRSHIRVIPEWFGGGTLPRKELHEAAEQLTANQAGLIAVGEPTIERVAVGCVHLSAPALRSGWVAGEGQAR